MEARVLIRSKKGIITTVKISTSLDPQIALAHEQHFKGLLKDTVIHEIPDFHEILTLPPGGESNDGTPVIATWLNSMFGIRTDQDGTC